MNFGTGFVQGFLGAQKMKKAKEAENRQLQAYALQMQKAQMELGKMREEETWQIGKAKAAEEGGLNGVIQYMETTRPEEGLKIKKMQMDYENSIQESQYRKALTQGKETDNYITAMKSAGDMYGQLNEVYNKDPQLAQQAYEKNFDLIKQLDPNAPSKFDPDRAMMAMGLSVPQSIKYGYQQQAQKVKAKEGEDLQSLMLFKQQGNIIGANTVLEKFGANQGKVIEANRNALTQEMKIIKDNEAREEKLRKEYIDSVKAQSEMSMAVSKMESLYSDDDIYTNPQKQVAMINQYARFNSPGVVTEFDEEAAKKSPLLSKLWQMKQQIETGAPLPKEAVDGIAAAIRSQWKGQQPYIETQEKFYKDLATKAGLKPENIIPPKFKAIDEGVTQGELLSDIRKQVPNFNATKFIETNVKANPELGDYLKEHPEYKLELLKKYKDQLTAKPEEEQAAVEEEQPEE